MSAISAPHPAFSPMAKNREPLIGNCALDEHDERYPDWHKWLSVKAQYAVTHWIYIVFVLFNVCYLACKFVPSVDPDGKFIEYVMCLPVVNMFLGLTLLFGVISKVSLSTRGSMFFVGLLFFFIGKWPRLAVPAFGGLAGPFLIYMCLDAIYDEGAVQWGTHGACLQEHYCVPGVHSKFSVPAYMSTIAPGFANLNMLMFKGWCYGHIPKLIYIIAFALLMCAQTLAEYSKALKSKDTTAFDYRLSVPVYKRLIAFRLAILPVALGVALTSTQENLLPLLKEGVWQCEPMSW